MIAILVILGIVIYIWIGVFIAYATGDVDSNGGCWDRFGHSSHRVKIVHIAGVLWPLTIVVCIVWYLLNQIGHVYHFAADWGTLLAEWYEAKK